MQVNRETRRKKETKLTEYHHTLSLLQPLNVAFIIPIAKIREWRG